MPSARAGGLFRSLVFVTIVAVVGLIAFGGIVRTSGSGLGCPDWPLCHGKIIPPAERAVLIEYFHRIIASIVSVFILAVAAASWRFYKQERWILIPAAASVLVLIFQVVLGGITVLTELTPPIVMAHLATAEILLACMVLIYIVSSYGPPAMLQKNANQGMAEGQFSVLLLLTALFLFVLLMTGSYVVGTDADESCGQSWPLCLGKVIPNAGLPLIHMFHRLIALIVGVMVIWTALRSWQIRRERPLIARLGLAIGAVFLVQVLVGAANIWLGFPLAAEVLHLTIATITWGLMVAMVTLSLTPAHQLESGARHA